LHFDIINGKIWVQQNGTEWEVGEMLEAHGVPKHDIVAGFLPPELRGYSGYAVGARFNGIYAPAGARFHSVLCILRVLPVV